MKGSGTIINIVFVLVGTAIGLLIKKGIPERLQKSITAAIGLSTCFIGIGGVISKMIYVENGSLAVKDTMLMVVSLVVGAIVGELINIEKRLEKFGEFCKGKFKSKNERFVEGFVSASLLFCVGAMSIVGSLEDGLKGDFSVLFAKSVMDGTMSILFAAAMGSGVFLSVIPILFYQGGITLLAGVIESYLSETLINQLSLVGSVLIFAIGINFLTDSKIRIGNLLPAVLFPLLYDLVLKMV